MKEQDKSVSVHHFGALRKMLTVSAVVVATAIAIFWMFPPLTNSRISTAYIDSHQEEFTYFTEACGNNIAQENSRRIYDLSGYKCRIATDPSVVRNIVKSLGVRELPPELRAEDSHGSSIFFVENPWMPDFLSRTDNNGLSVWKDNNSNTVNKEFQNKAFLLWTLLNRFDNKGVQPRPVYDIAQQLDNPFRNVITLGYTNRERGCNFDLVIDIENGKGRYEFEPGCRGQGV